MSNIGGFQNLESDFYWSGTVYAPSPSEEVRGFVTYDGNQMSFAGPGFYAVAVRPDEVSAVPGPKAYAMLLLGFGAVLLAVRRQPR